MASGVIVKDECLEASNELKIKKTYSYITFGMSPDFKEIVVLKKSQSLEYGDFLSDMPEAECRWAVHDFHYDQGEGGRNALVFFNWSPDDAKIGQKMVFASCRDALCRSLVGIGFEIQGTDSSEIAYETVLEKVSHKA